MLNLLALQNRQYCMASVQTGVDKCECADNRRLITISATVRHVLVSLRLLLLVLLL